MTTHPDPVAPLNDLGSRLEELFGSVCDRVQCTAARRQALEDLIELAVEIAREGREGRKIGTLFVVGDTERVLEHSRSLILDPLHGHSPESLHITDPGLRETIKELAQLDGAFVVEANGTFRSAGRYIEVDLGVAKFLPGLGTRHAAAASITGMTDAVSIAVSQSSVVRVFAAGELMAEIVPELFLMSRDRLFTPHAAIRELPQYGITIAVAE